MIRDDGSCTEDFDCGARLGSRSTGAGLAQKDDRKAWAEVTIPVVLVSAASAERLVRLMTLHNVNIDGLGLQFYCAR